MAFPPSRTPSCAASRPTSLLPSRRHFGTAGWTAAMVSRRSIVGWSVASVQAPARRDSGHEFDASSGSERLGRARSSPSCSPEVDGELPPATPSRTCVTVTSALVATTTAWSSSGCRLIGGLSVADRSASLELGAARRSGSVSSPPRRRPGPDSGAARCREGRSLGMASATVR